MKRFISLLVTLLICLMSFSSFALAETYVPSPDLKTILARLEPHLVLVNKDHKLPENWLDLITLVPTTNSLGEEFLVEENTLKHFEALREELLAEGIQIEIDSAYRSLEEQQEIWDEWSADPELGPEYCEKYLARVGYSEHHTGLAKAVRARSDKVFPAPSGKFPDRDALPVPPWCRSVPAARPAVRSRIPADAPE